MLRLPLIWAHLLGSSGLVAQAGNMKIIHKTSNQVIDVPSEHAQMLFGQGWKEFINDERKVIHEEAKEIQQEAVYRKEEVLKHRGRPKSNRT